MKPRLSISVIIPTYNRNEPLCLSLGDIFAQSLRPDAIIVVDQTPEHDLATNTFLSQHAHDIHLVRHAVPNLPGARNIGLANCKSDIVLFLDDDARVGPDFVANHLANYQDATVMAVAGAVIETQDAWVDSLPAYASDPFQERFTSCWQYRFRRPVQHAPGGNMSFRRVLTDSVGMFDANYEGPAFREETDFFLRVSAAGHSIVYDPTCWILHKNGPKPGGCWDGEHRIHATKRAYNEAYFVIKNFSSRHWLHFLLKSLRSACLSGSALKSPQLIPSRMSCTWAGWRRALRDAPRKPLIP